MLIILLNLICLTMAVWHTLWPSFAFAHPSACYQALIWAHVAVGTMILMVPTNLMRHALQAWIAVLRAPLLPTGIRGINSSVICLLVMFFVGFGQVGLAAAILCQTVVIYFYRKRHDRLVDIAMEPVT